MGCWLPSAQALRLIVGGFLAPTLARIPEGLRPEVEAVVARRLARLPGGEG